MLVGEDDGDNGKNIKFDCVDTWLGSLDEEVHQTDPSVVNDTLFDELGLLRLRESYMKDDEKSPQERFAFVSNQFGSNKEHAQRLYVNNPIYKWKLVSSIIVFT